MIIKVAKLNDAAILPKRKNNTDAGMDFYALHGVTIDPRCFALVRTGVSVEIPEGYVLFLKPKGRHHFVIGSGVVDAHYEPGEIIVRVINPYDYPVVIRQEEAVCQGVMLPIVTPDLIEVTPDKMFGESERSGKGAILEM